MRRRFGSVVVLALLALVCGCQPQKKLPPPPPPPAPAEADPALWAGLSRGEAQALRAAMLRGQIEVSQRLVAERAGPAASQHLLRAINELYAPAKADYAARGLRMDESAFAQAAEAANAGASSKQMRWYTDRMLSQVDRVAPRDWSKAGAVKMLLSELAHQYGEGVQGGFVVNDAHYQDAYGLAIVAQQIIKDAIRDGHGKDQARIPEMEREAEGLVNMFPSASAPKSPTDAGALLSQINRVQLAFPAIE